MPTITLGSMIGGSAPSTWPSSTGLSLQAQPAPWLYSVRRTGAALSIGLSMVVPVPGPGALVFAAIAPHGGLAIEDACTPEEREVAAATRAGMQELGRLFGAARPQAVVVATPHNVHIHGAMGVVVSGRVAGRLAGAPPSISLDSPTEQTLAWLVLESLTSAGVPAVAVSFGANDPAGAVAP